jgi:CBS domain-containing protein
MKVADVMTRGIEPVDPAATVQQAATQMAEFDVGAVLVGTEERLEGILTDRDIILRVVVDGRHPEDVAVREVMSASLFACRPDDAVESAFAVMRERQIRRMPVLDDDGKPVGIVTLSDLSKAISGPEQVKEALRDISEPHRARKAEDKPEEPSAEGAGAAAAAPPPDTERPASRRAT